MERGRLSGEPQERDGRTILGAEDGEERVEEGARLSQEERRSSLREREEGGRRGDGRGGREREGERRYGV